MGKTSSAVKDRYNKKAYDQFTVRLKKGLKDTLKDICDKNGESMNSIITQAIIDYINKGEKQ